MELSVKNILTQLLPNCIRDLDTLLFNLLVQFPTKTHVSPLNLQTERGPFLLQTRSIYIGSNETGMNGSSAANSI